MLPREMYIMYSQIIKVADILNLFDCSNPYQCIG